MQGLSAERLHGLEESPLLRYTELQALVDQSKSIRADAPAKLSESQRQFVHRFFCGQLQPFVDASDGNSCRLLELRDNDIVVQHRLLFIKPVAKFEMELFVRDEGAVPLSAVRGVSAAVARDWSRLFVIHPDGSRIRSLESLYPRFVRDQMRTKSAEVDCMSAWVYLVARNTEDAAARPQASLSMLHLASRGDFKNLMLAIAAKTNQAIDAAQAVPPSITAYVQASKLPFAGGLAHDVDMLLDDSSSFSSSDHAGAETAEVPEVASSPVDDSLSMLSNASRHSDFVNNLLQSVPQATDSSHSAAAANAPSPGGRSSTTQASPFVLDIRSSPSPLDGYQPSMASASISSAAESSVALSAAQEQLRAQAEVISELKRQSELAMEQAQQARQQMLQQMEDHRKLLQTTASVVAPTPVSLKPAASASASFARAATLAPASAAPVPSGTSAKKSPDATPGAPRFAVLFLANKPLRALSGYDTTEDGPAFSRSTMQSFAFIWHKVLDIPDMVQQFGDVREGFDLTMERRMKIATVTSEALFSAGVFRREMHQIAWIQVLPRSRDVLFQLVQHPNSWNMDDVMSIRSVGQKFVHSFAKPGSCLGDFGFAPRGAYRGASNMTHETTNSSTPHGAYRGGSNMTHETMNSSSDRRRQDRPRPRSRSRSRSRSPSRSKARSHSSRHDDRYDRDREKNTARSTYRRAVSPVRHRGAPWARYAAPAAASSASASSSNTNPKYFQPQPRNEYDKVLSLPARRFSVLLAHGICTHAINGDMGDFDRHSSDTAPYRVILHGINNVSAMFASHDHAADLSKRFEDGKHVLSVLDQLHLVPRAHLSSLQWIFRHTDQSVELGFSHPAYANKVLAAAASGSTASRHLPSLRATLCAR